MPAIDTHKAVKTLCSAGFDDAQAEAVVEQINNAVNENVATKADIEGLASKADLERFATKADIEGLASKADLERFATKAHIEGLASKVDLERLASHVAPEIERLSTKLDNAVETLELRMERKLEKQATTYLRYVFVAVAAVAGLTKALDILIT